MAGAKAYDVFLENFPDGYKKITTSGSGFKCGARACHYSLTHQKPRMSDIPSIRSIAMATEEISKGVNDRVGPETFKITDNCFVEQLALALDRLSNSAYRLGIFVKPDYAFLVPVPEDQENREVVWIMADHFNPDSPNHYSGLAPVSPQRDGNSDTGVSVVPDPPSASLVPPHQPDNSDAVPDPQWGQLISPQENYWGIVSPPPEDAKQMWNTESAGTDVPVKPQEWDQTSHRDNNKLLSQERQTSELTGRQQRANKLGKLFRHGNTNKVVILVKDHPLPGHHPDYIRRIGISQAPAIRASLELVVGDFTPEFLSVVLRSHAGPKSQVVARLQVPLIDGEVEAVTLNSSIDVDALSAWLPHSELPPYKLDFGKSSVKYPPLENVPQKIGKGVKEITDAEYLSATCEKVTRVDFRIPSGPIMVFKNPAFWEEDLHDDQAQLKALVSPFLDSIHDSDQFNLSVLVIPPESWEDHYHARFDSNEKGSNGIYNKITAKCCTIHDLDFKTCVTDGLERPLHAVPRTYTFMNREHYSVTIGFGAADTAYRDEVLNNACRDMLMDCHMSPISGTEWQEKDDDLDVYGTKADGGPVAFLVSIPFSRDAQIAMPDIGESLWMVFDFDYLFHSVPSLMEDDELRRKVAKAFLANLIELQDRTRTRVEELETHHNNSLKKEQAKMESGVYDDSGKADLVDDLESEFLEEESFDKHAEHVKLFTRGAAEIVLPFVNKNVTDEDEVKNSKKSEEQILEYRVSNLARDMFQDDTETTVQYRERIFSLFDREILTLNAPNNSSFGICWKGHRVPQPLNTKCKSDLFFIVHRPRQAEWPAPYEAPFVKVDLDRMVKAKNWHDHGLQCTRNEKETIRGLIWRKSDSSTAKAEADAVRDMNGLKKGSARATWFEWMWSFSHEFPQDSIVDMYAAFPGLSTALQKKQFPKADLDHLPALKKAKGGVVSIVGAPGTGKTSFVMRIVHAISSEPCHIAGKNFKSQVSESFDMSAKIMTTSFEDFPPEVPEKSPFENIGFTRVVFTGEKNVQLDDALQKYLSHSDKVVRLFSYNQEIMHVFKSVVEPERTEKKKDDSNINKSFINLLNMTRAEQFKVRNPSLTQYSLSSQIKAEAAKDPGRWSDIVKGIKIYSSDPEDFKINKSRYFDKARECAETILKRSRVVFCTPVVAREIAKHHPRWYPGVVVGDEAGRMTEGLTLILTSCWPKAAVFLVGDPFQFGPVSTTLRGDFEITAGPHAFVHSYRDVFGPQRTVSLLARMDKAGVVDICLEKTWRSEGDCQVLAANDFYSGRMTLVNENKRDVSNLVANAFSSLFSSPAAKGCSVFVDLKQSQEEKVGTTFYNHASAQAVMGFVAWIARQNFPNCVDLRQAVPADKVRKARIMVITPYTAQRMLLRELLRKVSDTEVHHGSVDIRLVDESVGHEAEIVIYDMVRSVATGFTDNRHRLNVAVSRAIIGQIYIGSSNLITRLRNNNPLKVIYDYHEKRGLVLEARGYNKFCDRCHCHGHESAQCPCNNRHLIIYCNRCSGNARRRMHSGRSCPGKEKRAIEPLTGLHANRVVPVDDLARNPVLNVEPFHFTKEKKQRSCAPRVRT